MRIFRGIRKLTSFEEFEVVEEDEVKAREAVEEDNADSVTIYKEFNEEIEVISITEIKI